MDPTPQKVLHITFRIVPSKKILESPSNPTLALAIREHAQPRDSTLMVTQYQH